MAPPSLPSKNFAAAEPPRKDTIKMSDSPDAEMSDAEVSDMMSEDENATPGSTRQKGKGVDSSGETPMPLQKRRRVTRACDECRRKKIKCDGKQPCTHCQVYSYDCTYDKPSNRRRNPAPQYIEALESRLQRAEGLLRKFMPDVDLSDPSLDPSVQQEFRLREQARNKPSRKDGAQSKHDSSGSSSIKSDEQLLTMISGVGQLDFDDKGDYDFHGHSSGTVFFRRIKVHFKSLLGRDYHIPVLPRPPKPSGFYNLDSLRSPAAHSPGSRKAISPELCDLPPKVIARKLSGYSLKYATCLLRIVHVPSFYTMIDKIYEKSPANYGTDDHRQLALLYSVLALGCMYNVADDRGESKKPPYEIAQEQGLRYYTSARFLLQDITDCRDLTSLQALLFMILFVQSISNLSTCYGFVGIALRSALRMGLHRNLPHAQDTAIEAESRRRVFSVCRQLDIYVSALLGFPMLLNVEDIDQPLPTPVDDEYVTKDGIMSVPAGTTSFIEAFNAHAQLMDILSKVMKHIYPLKGVEQSATEGDQVDATYTVSYAKVKEMEKALHQWNEDLPVAWRPDSDGPEEVIRVRNLLRFAYAHVQLVLYRPFLHAVSPRVTAGKKIDDRSYACGAAGINVARNIVHIGIEMRKQVSLVGPYWFTLFTEFFAIISLVFYVLENENKPGTAEIMADAVAGRDMIGTLARRSVAADRISKSLEAIFEQLPEAMKKIGASAVPSRKRSAPGRKESSTVTLSPSAPHVQTSAADCSSDRGRASLAPAPSNISFDIGAQGLEFGFDDFSPSVQDVSPLDLTVTPVDVKKSLPERMQNLQHGSNSGLNQLHRLDAAMFPSEDPLAYPNQPGMELGYPPGSSQPHNPAQYYMPNMFDDSLEGQLMGPLPPYFMQTPGQPGFGFPAQMFSDPMLSLQVSGNQARVPQHHQQPSTHPQAPQNQQRRRMFNQFASASWSGISPHHD
ncbi:fungal-specific transcription factor domain-containing protein [Xylariales sp. AK1849]|nr:fungal-specific transcription factor domain-containing protein [Xylariales sp. AK1849]